jgi:hypothetical protein
LFLGTPDPRTVDQRSAPLADTGDVAPMSEFGEYLRQRRSELQPADVGLSTTSYRSHRPTAT